MNNSPSTCDFLSGRLTRPSHPNLIIGSGRAILGLREDYRQQLRKAREECGFQYLRCHGIFNDEMGTLIEFPWGERATNFSSIFSLFDFLLEIDMKPFVEMSFMPSALAAGEKTIFWWQGNISLPKVMSEWTELVTEFISVCTERYGEKELQQWYFEVWNEPDLPNFFDGSQEDYFKLYGETAKAIKAISSDYPVGGPATSEHRWIEEFITFCTENSIPLDFISTHCYAVEGALDEKGNRSLVMQATPQKMTEKIAAARKTIEESSLPDLPLHYTEWSTSYSPRDPVHDSYISPAYILSALKQVEGVVDSMSYWTFSDIFEETGPAPSPLHGGFGLLTREGIPKPTYHIFSFLNQLGKHQLNSTEETSFICTGGDDLQILTWNFQPIEQKGSNQEYFKKDLPVSKEQTRIFTIENFPEGTYSIQQVRIGYKEYDLQAMLQEYGAPEYLKPEQVSELQAKCTPRPEPLRDITVESDGILKVEIGLRPYDVVLFQVLKTCVE